jgi:D-threo-aldose 1-dehydrogenase
MQFTGALEANAFGRRDLAVTSLGLGTAPIGNFRRHLDDDVARSVIEASWTAGIRFFDTAPFYGHGLAEHRLGEALRWRPRDEFVVSTKVGRLLRPIRRSQLRSADYIDPLPFTVEYDYSYDGIMRSVDDSLQRLGLERIDVLLVHDVDVYTHGVVMQGHYFDQLLTDGWRALQRLRDDGTVSSVGLGVNDSDVCIDALLAHEFDAFLLAGRYTLLEQGPARDFLPLCLERGVSVIVGGVFNSGILATGDVPTAAYNYHLASAETRSHTARISAVCAEFDVSLMAAALQFVLAHPAIPTVVVGTRSVEHLLESCTALTAKIPTTFWTALREQGLIDPQAPSPERSDATATSTTEMR